MGNHYIKAKLLPKKERRLLRGHRWVYKADIAESPEIDDGELVDIYSASNKFICRAFYQKEGNIFGRIISYHQDEIDDNFFKNLFDSALKLRYKLFPNSNVFRWIYAESDGAPGLVIDRYGRTVVAETKLKFYEHNRKFINQALLSFKGLENVITNFSSKESYLEFPDQIKVELNGLNFIVPIKEPQKTGLFLDQRMNYIYSQKYMSGAEVLDCFSYIGVWSCHALYAGAKSVVSVESSEKSTEIARENLKLNGYEVKSEIIRGEVENFLQDIDKKFDVIILDPPAYIKKKEDYQKGFNKYINLNSLAIKKIKKEGFLVTCSCSHFISQTDFREIIKRAVRKEGRRAKLLEFHGASPDHPEHIMMPELSYLKCAILQIV